MNLDDDSKKLIRIKVAKLCASNDQFKASFRDLIPEARVMKPFVELLNEMTVQFKEATDDGDEVQRMIIVLALCGIEPFVEQFTQEHLL